MARARNLRWIWAVIIVLGVALVSSCPSFQPPASQRSFTTMDLLIDSTAMPTGWEVDSKRNLNREAHDLSVGDSTVIVFIADEELAQRPTQQFIHRYRNSSAARDVYEDFIHPAGDSPPEWTYHSSIADQSQFACYNYEGREPYPICEWAARYEEYVVIVDSWLITERMSLQDLEQVIRAVDTRMAEYLGSSQ